MRPSVSQERVGGLDVAVPDAPRVRRVERQRDLNAVVDRLPEGHRPPVQPRAQRLAFEQFRDDVRRAGFDTGVIHRDDVRMVQAAGRTRFAGESGELLGGGGMQADDLQRDVPLQVRVARAIDLAHPARAQQRDDLIPAQPVAR